MRKLLLLIVPLLLALPAGASADTGKTLSGGCTDPGAQRGFCARLVADVHLGVYFELESFRGGGRYLLCVRAPQRRESCVGHRLAYDPAAEAWIARVDFAKIGKPTGGLYHARWLDPKTDRQVGPKMHFATYPHRSEQASREEESSAG
jgi:hypothetical protein